MPLNENADNIGLSNLSKNIKIKKTQLGISLKKFAELSKVSYSNLNKLVNQEEIMPSVTTLKKLSEFLKVKVADMLKSGNLPQYIPYFSDKEYFLIEQYLNNNEIESTNFELSENFISYKAFSLEFIINILGKNEKMIYFFSPTAELVLGKFYFIKILEINQYNFVEIINEYEQSILVKDLLSDSKNNEIINLNNNQYKVLGTAVHKKLKHE